MGMICLGLRLPPWAYFCNTQWYPIIIIIIIQQQIKSTTCDPNTYFTLYHSQLSFIHDKGEFGKYSDFGKSWVLTLWPADDKLSCDGGECIGFYSIHRARQVTLTLQAQMFQVHTCCVCLGSALPQTLTCRHTIKNIHLCICCMQGKCLGLGIVRSFLIRVHLQYLNFSTKNKNNTFFSLPYL